MATSKHGPSDSATPPLYYPPYEGPMSDYITIEPVSFKETEKSRRVGEGRATASQPSINYLPPPFPPPGWVDKPETRQSFSHRHRKLISISKYLFIIAFFTIGFTTPLLVFHYRHTRKERQINVQYHLCIWLLITWGSACVSNMFINTLPYIFKFLVQWINPGHVKYWRIFRFLRLAVTLLGAAIGSCISFNHVSSLFLLPQLKTALYQLISRKVYPQQQYSPQERSRRETQAWLLRMGRHSQNPRHQREQKTL